MTGGMTGGTTGGTTGGMYGGVIGFDAVTVTYEDAAAPVLRDFSLAVEEGELCLVAGRTGVGKSTVLGAINGLVPHFTGGRLAGRVTVGGLDTRTAPPRELAHLVGVGGLDPLAGFVTDTVEDELAYTMEQLAVPPPRCASGSRRRWTCSASPSCAAVHFGPFPAASSSGWR